MNPSRNLRQGKLLMLLSICTRATVLVILSLLALWTQYLNLKVGYNNSRLVGLAEGPVMQKFYELSDQLFSLFGDPVEVMRSNAGMTWSIELLHIPFSDPIAALSLLAKNHSLDLNFTIGLIIPIALALVFGRVFCSYICPASLVFFFTTRLRKVLSNFFLFPQIKLHPGFAWGILIGGLLMALFFGHGIWTLILPYFSIGQVLFHSLALGTLSISVYSLVVFVTFDLIMGKQFVCRNICPTGRLLGFIGQKSKVRVIRDSSNCTSNCTACNDVCPMAAKPKFDDKFNCSLCAECLLVCPKSCLKIGVERAK